MAAGLFLVALAVYCFSSNGHVQTVDYVQQMWVAAEMAAGDGFSTDGLPAGDPPGAPQVGKDGKPYAAHDLGMSLLLYPLAALVPGAHRNGEPTQLLFFLASFVSPLVSALTVAVFASLLFELGHRGKTVIVTSLLYAFGTLIWAYAHISFDVTSAALFVLVAVWSLARLNRAAPQWPIVAVGGISMAWAVMIRIDSLAVALPLTVAVGYQVWRCRRRLGTAAVMAAVWTMPLVGSVTAYCWYNWVRFGSILNSGHDSDPSVQFNGSLWRGTLGQVFSPGRGLLIFSPLVLLAAFGWRRLLRRDPVVGWAAAGAVAAAVIAHGAIENWSGEDAWGPRYLVPVAALAVLPLGLVLESLLRRPSGLRRSALIGLCSVVSAAGVFVQVVGASTHYLLAKVSDNVHSQGVSLQELYWDLHHAQIFLQAKALWSGLSGRHPYVTVAEGGRASEQIAPVDWWWANELLQDHYTEAAVIGMALCFITLAAGVSILGRRWTRSQRPWAVPPADLHDPLEVDVTDDSSTSSETSPPGEPSRLSKRRT